MAAAKEANGNAYAYTYPTGPVHSIKANPAPLGLLCFGMTTCMLMFVDTEWANKPFVNTVLGYGMIYGGATQLIVGLMEYIRGNGFAGAAFSSYGCFWMGWFINTVLARQKITGPTDETGEILWFILWGVLTFCFFLFTLRKTICLQVVFSTLTITFFLLAGGVSRPGVRKAGGYIGFICAASAIYAAFADLAEEDLGLKLPGMQTWWPKKVPKSVQHDGVAAHRVSELVPQNDSIPTHAGV